MTKELLIKAIKEGDNKEAQRLWDSGVRFNSDVEVWNCPKFTGFPDGFTANGDVEVWDCPNYKNKE